MPQMIDHIVILVRDLDEASASYARAGFTVTPGGVHAGGATHNSLISFSDGTYFELIAFRQPDPPQDHPWGSRLTLGEGLIDYALASSDLRAEAEALHAHGFTGQPREQGRLRPDGQRLEWRVLRLQQRAGDGALPFIIEDITPRDLRVPSGDAMHHPLGVTRVAGLTLAVRQLVTGQERFHALLGIDGQQSRRGNTEAPTGLRFPLGEQWLEIVQPATPDDDIARHIKQFGEGPYEVVLSGPAGAEPAVGALLPSSTLHGARIRMVH